MKGDHQVVAFITVFFVGWIIGPKVSLDDPGVLSFLDYLMPLVAAFAGAFSAFLLHDNRNRRRENKKRRDNINRAIFVLVRQLQTIHGYKQSLDEHKERLERFAIVPPIQSSSFDDVQIDIESLTFLIDTPYTNDLMQLSLEQNRYEKALFTLRQRSEYHINTVLPAVEKSGINNFSGITLEQLKDSLGPGVVEGAIGNTDQMYEHIYDAFEHLKQMIERLNEIGREMFPGQVIGKLESKQARALTD